MDSYLELAQVSGSRDSNIAVIQSLPILTSVDDVAITRESQQRIPLAEEPTARPAVACSGPRSRPDRGGGHRR